MTPDIELGGERHDDGRNLAICGEAALGRSSSWARQTRLGRLDSIPLLDEKGSDSKITCGLT